MKENGLAIYKFMILPSYFTTSIVQYLRGYSLDIFVLFYISDLLIYRLNDQIYQIPDPYDMTLIPQIMGHHLENTLLMKFYFLIPLFMVFHFDALVSNRWQLQLQLVDSLPALHSPFKHFIAYQLHLLYLFLKLYIIIHHLILLLR